MSKIIEFIKELPKAELHLHIEGSLEPELMFELSKRNGVALKFKSVEEIKAAYNFSNLQSFLDIYYEGAAVLQKEQDFYDLAFAYFKKCNEDNVRHTEIFFDPQTHTERGISFETVIKGIKKAQKDALDQFGITSFLIPNFLRHLSEEDAIKTFEESLPFKDDFIGFGLDSSEVGHPPSKFQNVFKRVLDEDLITVAHAGEEGPTEYIWEALDLLKVSRIDHGVRSLEDDKLVDHLVRNKVPLTVCPLSNVKLCVFDELKNHNLKKMLDKSLVVTINSDDPSYFGGYMNDNYIQTAKDLDLTVDELAAVAKNSFKASFLTDEQKKAYLDKIDSLLVQYHNV